MPGTPRLARVLSKIAVLIIGDKSGYFLEIFGVGDLSVRPERPSPPDPLREARLNVVFTSPRSMRTLPSISAYWGRGKRMPSPPPDRVMPVESRSHSLLSTVTYDQKVPSEGEIPVRSGREEPSVSLRCRSLKKIGPIGFPFQPEVGAAVKAARSKSSPRCRTISEEASSVPLSFWYTPRTKMPRKSWENSIRYRTADRAGVGAPPIRDTSFSLYNKETTGSCKQVALRVSRRIIEFSRRAVP